MSSRTFTLASGSPRRRALLAAAGLRFHCKPAQLDESAQPGEQPDALVTRLALAKAKRVAREKLDHGLLLGADTIVVLNGKILGKPRDAAHALAMLTRLSGCTHEVRTGVALLDAASGRAETVCVTSRVTFRRASENVLRAYIATGEPFDKAGAYALQGEGARFIERVKGSHSNVIGLPMDETLALLARAGVVQPATQRDIGARLGEVRERIAAAAGRAGRSAEDITLLGVGKQQPAEAVAAAVRAGVTCVGENYAQELRDKAPAVSELLAGTGLEAPRWHFIGQLQRNKARLVAPIANCVESVDRESLARELDTRARAAGRKLDVLLQVKLDDEAQRKGGATPDELPALCDSIHRLDHLNLRGLMTVPPADGGGESTRRAFARLRELRDELGGSKELPELSMGMSSDFEVAIEEGASIIRIGTAIFGPRRK